MTQRERTMMQIHARRSGLEGRVRAARALIGEWLARSEKPYVAFSGGKDSTVLLDLVRSVEPGVVALFGDDEHLLPGTEELLGRTENVVRLCGPVTHCEWYTSWKHKPERLVKGAVWVESDPRLGSVVTYARQEGFDGAAVGLRTEESGVRTVHIRAKGRLFYAEAKGLWQCYPIASWSHKDVWAYIVSRGLAYHAAYDRMAEVGIPLKERRVGPFAPKCAEGKALASLRRAFPRAFDRFAEDFPIARSYA